MANVTSKFAKHQLRCCPVLYQDKKETKDVVTHQSNTGELISRHSASGRCRDWLIALPVCHSILFCPSYNMDLRLSMCLTTPVGLFMGKNRTTASANLVSVWIHGVCFETFDEQNFKHEKNKTYMEYKAGIKTFTDGGSLASVPD